MCGEKFKNRKTFFIKHLLDGSIASTKLFINVDIPFPVDEIRIKQALICDTADTDDCYSIRWDGIGDLFLFDYASNISNLDIRIYTNNKQIQGTQTFYILDGDNSTTNTPVGNFGFVFEAIQY